MPSQPAPRPQRDDRRSRTWLKPRHALAACTLIAAFAYLLAIPLGLIPKDNRLGTPEVVVAVGLTVSITLMSQNIYSLKELTLGSSGVTAQFQRIEARQNHLEAEVRALQVALSGLVTKFEVIHLEKLSADGTAKVRFGEIMLAELTHLDAMQFIRPVDLRGLNAMRQDHGSGLDEFDLKSYVEITKEGLEYLALRAQLAARTAADHVAS